jgi:hypothetical protein
MRGFIVAGTAVASLLSGTALSAGNTCADRAREYGASVAGDRAKSASEEWDRLGRDCLERRSYADGIRVYRRGLALHPELKARLTNLAAVYSESGLPEVAYCLTPENKALRKAWERKKQTARLCPETEKRKFTYVPVELP